MAKKFLVLVALILVFGCTGPRYKIVPAQGKIYFSDGTPLPEGTRVLFNPVDGKVGIATGVTLQDGSFVLKHASGVAGAEVCKYTVSLRAPQNDDGTFFQKVSAEYSNGEYLSAEVKEDMKDPITLVVYVQQKR